MKGDNKHLLIQPMAVPSNRSTNHSGPLPYLACLVPDVSMETQNKLRFISNSVLLPLDLTLAVLSFFSNFLFLFAVARIKTQQHPSLILFCSLSATDLIWATFCFYRDVKKYFHVHLCPPTGGEETFLAILCIFSTLANLVVISEDRYRAVSSVIWYFSHMTSSRARKKAFISWLASVTLAVVVSFLPVIKIKTIIGVIFGIACSLIIVFCHVGIFVANRAHRKSMPQRGARQAAAALSREKKVAKTVGIILVLFVFTHLPALAVPFVVNALGYTGSKGPFRLFFTVFLTFNGLVNPMINFRRNVAIRRSVCGLFGCQCHIRLVPRTEARDGKAQSLEKADTIG